MSEWIKVTERLPEEGAIIRFCSNDYEGVLEGWLREGKWIADCDTPNLEVEAVTHWTPLPDPPTGD